MTRYIGLAEYFWLAEQVTGVDAATLSRASRSDLAEPPQCVGVGLTRGVATRLGIA